MFVGQHDRMEYVNRLKKFVEESRSQTREQSIPLWQRAGICDKDGRLTGYYKSLTVKEDKRHRINAKLVGTCAGVRGKRGKSLPPPNMIFAQKHSIFAYIQRRLYL